MGAISSAIGFIGGLEKSKTKSTGAPPPDPIKKRAMAPRSLAPEFSQTQSVIERSRDIPQSKNAFGFLPKETMSKKSDSERKDKKQNAWSEDFDDDEEEVKQTEKRAERMQSATNKAPTQSADPLGDVLKAQALNGSWKKSVEVLRAAEINNTALAAVPQGVTDKVKPEEAETVWLTLVVVAWLEKKQSKAKGRWNLIVEKAKSWLEGKLEAIDDLLTAALAVVV